MGVTLVKTDKLSVFHPNTGKHAGTLTLTATYEKDAKGDWRPPAIEWTWQGGALGPQNGDALWKTDNGAYFLLESTGVPQGSLVLTNSRWRYAVEYRPWFQRGDTIRLRDWNFGKNRTDPFIWECKIITSAG
jgi:hypothetical protein